MPSACIATYFLGARIHNPTTGLVGAAFLASSPAWLFQIVQPMSDVPAAALWTCALLAATTGAAAIAGITAALALLIRPNLFPLAASAAIVLFAWTHDSLPEFSLRTRTRRAFVFAITASLGIVGVATMQWRLYGHPFASGHGSFTELFAVGNIPANVHDYSVRMLRGEMPVLIVAASCLAALILTRRSTSLPPIARACRLLLITAVPVLICYVPYGVFPDWSYLRFLLPAFPFAFIVVGTLVSEASVRVPSQARGVVLVLTLVAVVSANVTIAKREATFDLHTYESRYQTAGRYLEAVLPRDVVIVMSQQSVGAHFYTGLPILRWDLLNADLDAALGTLAGLGRHPVLLVRGLGGAAAPRAVPDLESRAPRLAFTRDLRHDHTRAVRRSRRSRRRRRGLGRSQRTGLTCERTGLTSERTDLPRSTAVTSRGHRGFFLVVGIRLQDELANAILRGGVTRDWAEQCKAPSLAIDRERPCGERDVATVPASTLPDGEANQLQSSQRAVDEMQFGLSQLSGRVVLLVRRDFHDHGVLHRW